MNTILAIDPGPIKSAYVIWDGEKILDLGIVDNKEMLSKHLYIMGKLTTYDAVIEKVTSYGMAVGESVFDTVFWTGQFYRHFKNWGWKCNRVPRMDVKMHLCHSSRAKDSNIRQALIDRFEPDLPPKCRPKGILKGISKDCWQALALAVYFWDTRKENSDAKSNS